MSLSCCGDIQRGQRTFSSIVIVGLICFAISFFWTIWVGAIELGGEESFSTMEIIGFLLLVAVLTPLIESVAFAAPLFFVTHRSLVMRAGYAGAMCLFGWLAHGGSWVSVGKGASFGVLAVFTYHVTETRSLRAGILSNISAHVVWNVTAILAALIAASLAT